MGNPLVVGIQTPGKYQYVGPNYKQYGEQPTSTGIFYDPQTDRYYPASKKPLIDAQRKQEQDAAGGVNHPPGLAQQLAPIAAAGGALWAGNKIGGYIGDKVTQADIGGKVDGLLEIGKASTPTPATTPASGYAPAGAGIPAAASTGAAPAPSLTPPAYPTQSLANGQIGLSDGSSVPAGVETPTGFSTNPPVKTLTDGSVQLQDGSVVAPGQPVEGFNWVQGAGGALQLVAAYNSYEHGDKLGAGIQGVAGGATLAAASPGLIGTGAAESAGAVAGVAVPVAGAYGAYQTYKGINSMPAGGQRNSSSAISGAASGAAIGSLFGPGGILIGAGVGALAGLAGSVFGSHKDKFQLMRDAAREQLQKQGILDDKLHGTLADGSTFDFGKDGKGGRKLDFNDVATQKAAAFANIIAATEGATGKSQQALATLYTQAATSNANGDPDAAVNNIRHFAQQRGFTPENVQAQLDALYKDGKISDNEYKTWSSDKNTLFDGSSVAGGNDSAPSAPAEIPMAPTKQQTDVLPNVNTTNLVTKPQKVSNANGLLSIGAQ